MIYTVTFNPALDYVVHMDEVLLGAVNRSHSEEIYYGGKGINVSMVLKNLGVDSIALGFVAGFTGEVIEKGVKSLGVKTDFIPLEKGISRINVKIKSKEEMEINGQGPDISDGALQSLLKKIEAIENGDTLVLAGSIPASLPSDIYENIMAGLQARSIRVVVDATKELLRNVLKYEPFLIKPNNHELGEMFGVEINTTEEIIHYAKELQKEGARNVLVSRAKEGAVLVTETGELFQMGVPKGVLKNSVGAGDSMVAGFLAGYLEKQDYGYALKMGTAAGSATAFSDGLADQKMIQSLFETL